jgi:glutathione S-transferase
MNTTVFGSRLSPFVEKVVRGLHLKGLPYTMVPVRSPADFKKWNPQTQKMPVLEIDGARTFDSSRILRRIDELVPEPPLFDRDPKVGAQQRFLEDWSDESLYWYVMAYRWAAPNENASATQVAGSLPFPAFLQPILKMFIARQIKGQALAQGLTRLPFDVLYDEFGRRLDELVVLLGERPFFYADRPSGADLALFGQCNTIASGPTPQADAAIRQRPALVAWRQRVDQATAAKPAATAPPRLAVAATDGGG